VVARAGDVGLTTEIAALVTFLAGALCYWGLLALAAALAVGTTALLALKLHTRLLAQRITREDVYATLKFAFITAIVLPVLPAVGFGPSPFDVLVPRRIWLMVVFISGISFLGYFMIKLLGARRGVGLTGILGGLASSTAVTLSFAGRSRDAPELARSFALAILLAWSIMFFRVIVEVVVVNPPLLTILWIPMTAAAIVALSYSAYLFRTESTPQEAETGTFRNPFSLIPALTFGALYAIILLTSNAAQLYLGTVGVYASSIVAGLADVDAITLSMAHLSRDALDMEVAARAIVLAAASNTIVKGGIVMATGSKSLRRAILPGLILIVATVLVVGFRV
jgi:uncharacterized membrane protein (DUF4010 family)